VLRELIVYMTRRVAGDEGEELAAEVADWIEQHLGPDYPWPGNYRELEQCVKNVLIRRDYRPAGRTKPAAADQFAQDLRDGNMTADELLRRYCALVYSRTGSYEETARRLGLDRRTVKSKISNR
jgi:DNA-binding NtrC family response regulator